MAFSNSRRNGGENYDNYGSSASGKSYFGKTMKIDGEITSEEDLTVEGKVTGKLRISKTLTIGNEGHVDGEISAAVVRISGEAEGQLVASDKLEIESQGKYHGNIQAERIVIAEGAQMKGTVNVQDGQVTATADSISDQEEIIEEEIIEEEIAKEEIAEQDAVEEEIVEGEVVDEEEEKEEKEKEEKETENEDEKKEKGK